MTAHKWEVIREHRKTKTKISEEDFKELRAYSENTEGKVFLVNSQQKTITAKNYVGYIQTKKGFGLEILPKIDLDENDAETRKIFLRMLQAYLNYKELEQAHLDEIKNFPLLEAFIAMFLKEVEKLLKSGIQKNYQSREENLCYWKGKFLINQNIKHNLFRQDRFFYAIR